MITLVVTFTRLLPPFARCRSVDYVTTFAFTVAVILPTFITRLPDSYRVLDLPHVYVLVYSFTRSFVCGYVYTRLHCCVCCLCVVCVCPMISHVCLPFHTLPHVTHGVTPILRVYVYTRWSRSVCYVWLPLHYVHYVMDTARLRFPLLHGYAAFPFGRYRFVYVAVGFSFGLPFTRLRLRICLQFVQFPFCTGCLVTFTFLRFAAVYGSRGYTDLRVCCPFTDFAVCARSDVTRFTRLRAAVQFTPPFTLLPHVRLPLPYVRLILRVLRWLPFGYFACVRFGC